MNIRQHISKFGLFYLTIMGYPEERFVIYICSETAGLFGCRIEDFEYWLCMDEGDLIKLVCLYYRKDKFAFKPPVIKVSNGVISFDTKKDAEEIRDILSEYMSRRILVDFPDDRSFVLWNELYDATVTVAYDENGKISVTRDNSKRTGRFDLCT